MVERAQPVCDVCKRDIHPNPKLFDKQGQLWEIRSAARRVRLHLCEEHGEPLHQYFEKGDVVPGGTLPPTQALPYMPFKK